MTRIRQQNVNLKFVKIPVVPILLFASFIIVTISGLIGLDVLTSFLVTVAMAVV